MSLFRRKPARRLPRRKKCERYEKVAGICDRVLMGEVEHTEYGLRTLAEEYLDLHLEFQALLTHLNEEPRRTGRIIHGDATK